VSSGSLILDGSATLAWIYPDEITTQIIAVFDHVVHLGAIVPSLWRIEVANSLTVSIRRSRITQRERDVALKSLGDLHIITDPETDFHLWSKTLSLADKHKLTVYDATYLELALRRQFPLATLDKELRIAAELEGVQLLGI
jgi:predicted nucleic acid-binding protein